MQDGAIENLRAGYDSHCGEDHGKIGRRNSKEGGGLIYRTILIVT